MNTHVKITLNIIKRIKECDVCEKTDETFSGTHSGQPWLCTAVVTSDIKDRIVQTMKAQIALNIFFTSSPFQQQTLAKSLSLFYKPLIAMTY